MTRAETAEDVHWESRVRGLLLGLALGDAWCGTTSPRRGTATTALACFVTEGLIRALVRQRHKGICRESSVIWHAHLRWAHRQEISMLPTAIEPSGWLMDVPALGRRRADALAVVAALRAHTDGISPAPSANPSRGHHALTRLAALAVGVDDEGGGRGADVAQECAAATHAHPEIPGVVARGVTTLGLALHATDIPDWSARVERLAPRPRSTGSPPPLAARAALDTALDGVRAHAGQIGAALDATATSPAATGATPLCGALLEALHGVEALPGAVWDLELGHVVDTLARDLAIQTRRPRDGDEQSEPLDPHWWDRYPGF